MESQVGHHREPGRGEALELTPVVNEQTAEGTHGLPVVDQQAGQMSLINDQPAHATLDSHGATPEFGRRRRYQPTPASITAPLMYQPIGFDLDCITSHAVC